MRVSDRARTGDRLDHNQELYQLSYAHHVRGQFSGPLARPAVSEAPVTPAASLGGGARFCSTWLTAPIRSSAGSAPDEGAR